MSRHARHDIDLSALPTVADVDDDDLIDRDEKWHEYQSTRQSAALPAEPEPVHMPEPEMKAVEPEPEFFPEPDMFVEAPQPGEETPVIFIQPPRVEHVETLALKADEKADELPPVLAPKSEVQPVSKDEKVEKKVSEISQPPKPDVVPEGPLTVEEKRRRWWQDWKAKIGARSLGVSVGIHALILLLGAAITVRHVMDKQVDFLPGGSPQSAAASEALEHKVRQKKNTWLKNKPMSRVTVQSITADVQLPEMEMDSLNLSGMTERMELGKLSSGLGLNAGMGAGGSGGGFGAGIGKGGMFSFLGQTAFGRRVVFVVDVSASMSQPGEGGTSRFDVLKKELVKSLDRVPSGTQYQILFFSDFAWPHDKISPKRSEEFGNYTWRISSDEWKKAKIPAFAYLLASPFNLADSRKIVQEADNPGGTNWGSGLLMALKANPKPDIIFFMTDGQKIDEQGWINVVTDENKRSMTRTVIHTSVIMETDAAADMDRLAKANGGTFSVVLRDGTVVKGDQFFGN
jgi:hypothetical protein